MGEETRILTAIMGAGEERKRRTGGGKWFWKDMDCWPPQSGAMAP